jgi:hypothetical protein
MVRDSYVLTPPGGASSDTAGCSKVYVEDLLAF